MTNVRSDIVDRLRRLARWFALEREIIVRANGQVRYVRVGLPHHCAVALVVLAVGGWGGFMTYQYVTHAEALAQRESRIAEVVSANDRLRDEIAGLEGDLAEGARELAAANAANAQALRDMEAVLARKDAAKARAVRDMEAILARKDAAYADLKRQLGATQIRLSTIENARRELAGRFDEAMAQVARLERAKATLAEDRAALRDKLGRTKERLAQIAAERGALDAEREDLNRRVAALAQRIERFEESQAESISRLGERARESIAALERTLVVAGLDAGKVLDRMADRRDGEAGGMGGPLMAIDDDAPGGEVAVQLAAVERRVGKLQSLQELMKRLPLAVPLDDYRITSHFGRRFDPFTDELAMHAGTDFASRPGTPVRVTAPGTVTFVGWKGGFGKMVEVDHGLGIRTRYAHMSRIFVERGQVVEFREKVGLVGNTGRSTALHLHYEVMVDGRQVDPANFMRAGQYVFKN